MFFGTLLLYTPVHLPNMVILLSTCEPLLVLQRVGKYHPLSEALQWTSHLPPCLYCLYHDIGTSMICSVADFPPRLWAPWEEESHLIHLCHSKAYLDLRAHWIETSGSNIARNKHGGKLRALVFPKPPSQTMLLCPFIAQKVCCKEERRRKAWVRESWIEISWNQSPQALTSASHSPIWTVGGANDLDFLGYHLRKPR